MSLKLANWFVLRSSKRSKLETMMKMLLLVGVAAAALGTGTAFAADLPSRTYAPVAPIVAPVFTWTGFYLGVNAGYGFSTNDSSVVVPGVGIVKTSNNNGFVGGAQGGYNYQVGQIVFGLETDIQYADLRDDRNNFGVSSNGLDYFGTVRGRIGAAFDRFLVFGTGGFAYGGGDNTATFVNGVFVKSGNDTNGGYTAGGGVEYAFTNNITAKVEGLYVNIDRNHAINTLAGDSQTEFGVVRAGLNYKF
jgi:outer membrane immunogenic protein